jgi:hypothetical protein
VKCSTIDVRSRDILSRPLLSFILFGVPVIAIIASGQAHIGAGWRTGIWTSALGIMGVACIANAARCGRVHCYLTGPFFFAIALVTLLYGLGILPLGRQGWNLIALTVLVGAVLLCCLPEFLWGRYKPSRR